MHRRLWWWRRHPPGKQGAPEGRDNGLSYGGYGRSLRQDSRSRQAPARRQPRGVRAALRRTPPLVQEGGRRGGGGRWTPTRAGNGGGARLSVETVEVPVAVPYPVVVGAGLDLTEVVADVLQPR